MSPFCNSQKKCKITENYPPLLMLKYLIIPLLVWCFGCTNKFEDQIEESIADNVVDKSELQTLEKIIQSSDDKTFKRFIKPDHSIDHSGLNDYLAKYVSRKFPEHPNVEIWKSDDVATAKLKFNANVFLENSASIDGYVTDNAQFKTAVFKLLTDLKNLNLVDSLNLNYINTRTINVQQSATHEQIEDFYKRLNSQDFRKGGIGNRGSTDIEDMLKIMLEATDDQNLSVFISDCVFSPGKRDAKKFLDGQYAAIYNDFVSFQNSKPTLSLIVLQCIAQFDGTYYDYLDKQHPKLSIERPYYVWFIGNNSQIENLIESKILENIKDGYKNKLIISPINETTSTRFKILYNPKIGEFDAKLLPQQIISKASTSKDNRTKGIFEFNVAVDFSNTIQDGSFFLDPENYSISNKAYKLKVKQIVKDNNPALQGFTHILTLTTSNLSEEALQINVIGKIPSWINDSSSEDDTSIESDLNQHHKTFGLNKLLKGVYDAFYPKSKTNALHTLNITIKK
mgnify:CR=1 FL=1